MGEESWLVRGFVFPHTTQREHTHKWCEKEENFKKKKRKRILRRRKGREFFFYGITNNLFLAMENP